MIERKKKSTNQDEKKRGKINRSDIKRKTDV